LRPMPCGPCRFGPRSRSPTASKPAVACGSICAGRTDLDLRGRKAGGILCTSRVTGRRAAVGCGIGLNVQRPRDAALAAIDPPPAYLSDAQPRAAREEILAGILGAMDGLLDVLDRPADPPRARGRTGPNSVGGRIAFSSTRTERSSRDGGRAGPRRRADPTRGQTASTSCTSPMRACLEPAPPLLDDAAECDVRLCQDAIAAASAPCSTDNARFRRGVDVGGLGDHLSRRRRRP